MLSAHFYWWQMSNNLCLNSHQFDVVRCPISSVLLCAVLHSGSLVVIDTEKESRKTPHTPFHLLKRNGFVGRNEESSWEFVEIMHVRWSGRQTLPSVVCVRLVGDAKPPPNSLSLLATYLRMDSTWGQYWWWTPVAKRRASWCHGRVDKQTIRIY